MELNLSFGAVNYIAALVGAVFNMILGTLWYGPLFGNLWLKLIDKKKEDIEGNPLMYVFSFIAAFAAAIVLYLAVTAFGATTFIAGLLIGLIPWAGFVSTVTLTFSIFEGPKLSVWLLFVAYQFVIFCVLGGVFAVW